MEKIIISSVLSFPKILIFLERLPTPMLCLCNEGKAIIVGGAFRSLFSGEEPKDIDFFIQDREEFLGLVKEFGAVLDAQGNGAQCQINGLIFDLQWTLDYPLMDVLLFSDLSIAQVGYTKNQLFYNEDFFSHVKERKFSLLKQTLNLQKTEARIKKYQGYGFTYSC